MDGKIVEVKNITKKYGNKVILNNISFDIGNGINALLGNNGAGKTTLLNILAGLDTRFSGNIFIDGIELNSKNYPLEKVGYLPQNFDMFHNISGLDYLNYVYNIKGYPEKYRKEKIDEIIQRLSLDKVINKRIGSYSGGFKRRLGIAQAYVGFPDFVILDEPTTGLDPEQREEFRSLLFQFSKEKNTLISTHIIEDVELFCSKIILLKDTEIAFSGEVNTFIKQASKDIFSFVVPIDELDTLPIDKMVIVEKKRKNSEEISIKYIPIDGILQPNSHQKHRISLENAYVYHQKINL